MACKGVVGSEEQVWAMQSSKTPAPNSSSADGVDNTPREDPVCHTSVSGHAVKKLKKMPIVNIYWPLTQQAVLARE